MHKIFMASGIVYCLRAMYVLGMIVLLRTDANEKLKNEAESYDGYALSVGFGSGKSLRTTSLVIDLIFELWYVYTMWLLARVGARSRSKT